MASSSSCWLRTTPCGTVYLLRVAGSIGAFGVFIGSGLRAAPGCASSLWAQGRGSPPGHGQHHVASSSSSGSRTAPCGTVFLLWVVGSTGAFVVFMGSGLRAAPEHASSSWAQGRGSPPGRAQHRVALSSTSGLRTAHLAESSSSRMRTPWCASSSWAPVHGQHHVAPSSSGVDSKSHVDDVYNRIRSDEVDDRWLTVSFTSSSLAAPT